MSVDYTTAKNAVLSPKPERDLEIYKKKILGATYRALAKEFDLDVSRIVAICKRAERNILTQGGRIKKGAK